MEQPQTLVEQLVSDHLLATMHRGALMDTIIEVLPQLDTNDENCESLVYQIKEAYFKFK